MPRIIKAIAIWLVLIAPASAQITLLGTGDSGNGSVTPVPFYTQDGSFETGSNGSTASATMNVGTASASRIIIVGISSSSFPVPTGVTVNSVACTLDAAVVGSGIASCPGASYGSGNQTVTVTWSASGFFTRGFTVWSAFNMTSTTVIQHVANNSSSTSSLAVTAKDFLFAAVSSSNGGAPSFANSSELPANNQTLLTNNLYTADFNLQSSNATFALAPTVPNLSSFSGATYH
jgi:hypothetical protein